MRETLYKINGSVDITIGLLADTHNAEPGEILSSLSAHHPDIIAIAGDILVGYRPSNDEPVVTEQENVLKLISGCAAIAPTYISLGNHEWMISDDDIKLLEENGAVVLDNTYIHYNAGKHELVIGGLTSAIVTNFQEFRRECYETGTDMSRYPYRPRHSYSSHLMPETAWLSDFEKEQGYKVLLCHHPEYWSLREPQLCHHPIDLVLSGHAHGGQVRLFGRGVYAPGQGWMPKYTSGVFEGEHGKMLVSRGLANTAGPVPRVFNPTEVVYVEVRQDG